MNPWRGKKKKRRWCIWYVSRKKSFALLIDGSTCSCLVMSSLWKCGLTVPPPLMDHALGFLPLMEEKARFWRNIYGCPCFFGFSPLQGRKDMVAFLSLEENRLQSVFFLFFLSFFSSERYTNFAFVAQRFLLWSMVDSLLHGCFGLSEVALV